MNEQIETTKKNKMKSFESWIDEYGCIKQIYTNASLLQMMSKSSLFFLANEGDAILQESSFYNPCHLTADIKQGTLIDCKRISTVHISFKQPSHSYNCRLYYLIRLGW